ncbi:GNAT family N-acetyltransferase [Pedobacter polaris]|uniref:GNAT family N-acetyltransferase n=1 Tax=Pedobacter polaris TaxID=2571273 RepID=A0A4U1CK34_9SPHI|nr:GNAT family N-acetyltransferase [Pedobacter polaris]TKC07990.1 GNAT family N-acetyltransferase [Pedobacter polaris]
MKIAQRKDRVVVIDILAQSFSNNLSVNYIIKQDYKRELRINALMQYSFDICFEFGRIYLSDDYKGCALVIYPHLKKNNLKAIWLDIKLIFKSIGIWRINSALKRENLIKSKYPNSEFTYLWFIGVKDADQKKGIGSNLLRQIIEDSDMNGLDILLETSTLINVPWYESFDFRTYNTILFDYTLFMLKRPHR